MGVGRWYLWCWGRVPKVNLSQAQLATRDAVRADSSLLIGIHANGHDGSRSAPWLADMKISAPGSRLILLDTTLETGGPDPSGHRLPVGQMALADAIAVIAACDYLVAVDDWILQLGAALDVPTLGVAGPSMTPRLMGHHPRLLLLEPPAYLPCRPCWRSASQPCVLTGLRRSACLASNGHESAQAALKRLIAAYPQVRNSVAKASRETISGLPVVVHPVTHQAFHREDSLMHPLVRAVREGLRYVELEAIVEQIEALQRMPLTPSGYPSFRPQDCRVVTAALEKFLLTNLMMFEAGSQELGTRFLNLADRLAGAGLHSYPNEALQLDKVRARALIALGREAEALTILGPIVARPYLVEGDMSVLAGVLELDSQARLSLGRLHEVRRDAFTRVLMIVRLQPWQAARLFDHLMNAMTIGRGLTDRIAVVEPVLRLAARLRLRALMLGWRKRIWQNRSRYLVARAVEFCVGFVARQMLFLIALNRKPHLLPDASLSVAAVAREKSRASARWRWRTLVDLVRDRRPVLVTRGMGGLGDIMTMTPGMTALAQRMGQPVHFATRKGYHPLLENNPSIKLLDIEQPIDPRQYRRWVNLSFCPAAEYEASVWPRVRKGRVQLFARRMGVSRRALDAVGWLPRCFLSLEQEQVRDSARARFAVVGLPAIAVQPYARELYRSYPAMTETIHNLADEAVVVVFHTSPLKMPEHPNIITMFGSKLSDSIATVAACDYYLGVDSAFFHVAVAFGLPCLGFFGPTSGMVRTSGRRYPNVRLMPHAQRFTCAPCWRNEDMPCYVSGGYASTCLTSADPLALADEMRRLMRDYPVRRSKVPITSAGVVETSTLESI
jgi:ADP-heptose:LPS heptosyltransferase